jgi:hypothetical protein
MVNVKPLTLIFHLTTIKLCLIISDQDFRNFKSANDVLPQEGDDLVSGDIYQNFCFHLLGEVVHNYQNKLFVPYGIWERTQYIHPLLGKEP